MAQGAAQGVEDAASLGVVLSSISSKEEVPLALKAYEKAQKARAEHIQQSCLTTRVALHLPDGPEQEARDLKFKALSAGGASDDKWGDPEMQRFLWTWDAEVKAEEAWKGESTLPWSHLCTMNFKLMLLVRYHARVFRSESTVSARSPRAGSFHGGQRPAPCTRYMITDAELKAVFRSRDDKSIWNDGGLIEATRSSTTTCTETSIVQLPTAPGQTPLVVQMTSQCT